MSSRLRYFLSCISVIVFMAGMAQAQVAGAALGGSVTDSTGAAIPKAEVNIANEDTGIVTRVPTNDSGIYRAVNLLPGRYDVSASSSGFATSVQKGIVLAVGADVKADIQLKPGATQVVEVTSSVPTIDTTTATLSSVVAGEAIRELPLNGRDWTSLAILQPGIASVQSQASANSTSSRGNRGWGNQLTVSGHRPQENNYRIDGVSINDYSNGAPGSAGGVNLGADAISEFSVLHSNYSSEYGRTSGGVINAITKSGTNGLHGSGYEFARNGALDARNYFNPTTSLKPDFSRNQFGGSLGGPIIKDKTFFFGDYEGIRQTQGVSQLLTVPSSAARAGQLSTGNITVDPAVKPFLAFWPLPNGPLNANGDTGSLTVANQQSLTENFYTARVDHHFSSSDSLFGTYLFDDSNFLIPDPLNNVTFPNTSRRQLIDVEETHTFTPTLLNTIRLGYNRTTGVANGIGSALNPIAKDPAFGTVPGLPAGLISISGGIASIAGLGSNTLAVHKQNSYQVYDDAFLSRGNHSIKFGFSSENILYSYLKELRPNGNWSFTSLSNFLQNKPRQVAVAQSQRQAADVKETVFAGYVEDDWRFSQRLTLNLGLRYEMSTNPTETKDRFFAVKDIFGGPLVPVHSYFDSNPTTKNFEPRIGFAWDPQGNGKTSVRAGFGIFDILPLPWIITPHPAGDYPFEVNTTVKGLPAGSFPKAAYGLADFSKPAGTYFDPNPKRSYAMNWHLTIQRELPGKLDSSIGYVGSRSLHEAFGAEDINTVFPIAQTPAGYVWPTSGGKPINPNVTNLRAVFFDASSSYHAVQTQISRPMLNNWQFQASYTFGKCIDTGSSGSRGDNFTNDLADLLWFDKPHRRGLCDFDIRHTFVLNSLYALPSPKENRVAAAVLGGWQLGGIFSANTGTPFTPILPGDPLGLGTENAYAIPDRLLTAGCTGNPVTGNPGAYIKTECFVAPTPSTRMGTAGRNSIIGPSLVSLNFALYKNVKFSERVGLQFRAEMFNALNHPNFAAPLNTNTVLQGNTGRLTSTQIDNRDIQLGARVRF